MKHKKYFGLCVDLQELQMTDKIYYYYYFVENIWVGESLVLILCTQTSNFI